MPSNEDVIRKLVARINEQSGQIAALQGLVAVLAAALGPIPTQLARHLAGNQFQKERIATDALVAFGYEGESHFGSQHVDKIAAAGKDIVAQEAAAKPAKSF